MEISGRLRAVAELLPPGARVADIGADHGQLSLWLAQKGHKVITTDLREGPLERARSTFRQVGREGDFRLCDGLSALLPEEMDWIVVAGMGGETIAAILDGAPWCKTGEHTLALQPMSKLEELRRYLIQTGFAILQETLVRENGTIYCVLKTRGGELPRTPEPWELYASGALLSSGEVLLKEYLRKQLERLKRAIAGARRSRKAGDQARLEGFLSAYAQLKQKEEEIYADGA